MVRSRGVTLIELLIVIALVAILSAVTFGIYLASSRRNALDADLSRIQTELQKARSLTLSSKYAIQYGLHFATSSVTVFEGTSYVQGSASNTVTLLGGGVTVSSINLVGGGSDVIFKRLTGQTDTYGTTTITISNPYSASRSIVIYKTGLSEIQ